MKSKPDYVYDPDNWEVTYGWADRSFLADDYAADGDLQEPRMFETLMQGPPVWVKEVVISRDEAGDPDETEVQWFDSFEEAQKA